MLITAALAALALPAAAQDASRPAKEFFGRHTLPTASAAQSFGSYANGCLAGGVQLAETGPSWQAMRLSRNRNWGHPAMIEFIHRLGGYAQAAGWPGVYVGDISQPRGGPMRSGHRSHQIGLDADIWLRQPVGRALSTQDRERIGSHVVVSGDGVNLNKHWSPGHHALLKLAASDAAVARIFVNHAIKRALCLNEPPGDRAWLRKIRPWRGHDSHFHVRLSCPADSAGCRNQGAPPAGDGCAEVVAGTTRGIVPQEEIDATPLGVSRSLGGSRSLALSQLPEACMAVLSGDANQLAAAGAGAGEFGSGAPPAPVYVTNPAELIKVPEGTVAANQGLLGSKYFWAMPIDLTGTIAPHIKLAAAGDLPPGLFFVDRGDGFGVLKGVPKGSGRWVSKFEILYAGEVAARMPVEIVVNDRGPSAEQLAAMRDPVNRIRAFVEGFEAGACLYSVVPDASASHASLRTFAKEADPIFALDAAFKSEMGFEADIFGHLITAAQCRAMALFERVPKFGDNAPTLVIENSSIRFGEPLHGEIGEIGVQQVSLLLVHEDGEVRDLTGYLEDMPGGGQMFDVPLDRRGPGIVIAVTTLSAVEAPDSSEPEEAERFFDDFLLRVMRFNFGFQRTYHYIEVR